MVPFAKPSIFGSIAPMNGDRRASSKRSSCAFDAIVVRRLRGDVGVDLRADRRQARDTARLIAEQIERSHHRRR
jgi:hypothetical protein